MSSDEESDLDHQLQNSSDESEYKWSKLFVTCYSTCGLKCNEMFIKLTFYVRKLADTLK